MTEADTAVQRTQAIFEFADLTLDARQRAVFRDAIRIPLPKLSYDLLLALVDAAPNVLTHDDVADRVWRGRLVTPETVAQRVLLLRRALGDDADNPHYLRVVRGQGFQLVPPVRRVVAPSSSTEPAPTITSPRKAPTRTIRFLAVAALLAAIGAAGFWILHAPGLLQPAAPTSVAVLPLAAPASDEELRGAAAGFSDSMIDALSRVPGLRVGGRASALVIGAAGAGNPAQTAQTLGVDNLIFGQITAHDAELGVRLELWHRGHPAPRVLLEQQLPRTQLFRALARSVDAAQAALTGANASGTDEHTDLSARDLYLLGRAQWRQRTPSSLQRAVDYFQRAVAADPTFALGWCGLADAYVSLQYSGLSGVHLLDKARSALAQAKALAPQAADTFVSEGLFYENQPGHRADTLLAYKHALERDPHHPLALLRYGNTLRYAFRVRDAIEWHGRALEFDPLNARLHYELAADYIVAGDEASAYRQIARVLALDPGNADVYALQGVLHEHHGRLADAAAAFAEGIARKPAPEFWEYFDLVRVYLRAGAPDLAEQALLVSAQTDSIEWLGQLAAVRIAQGRPAEALELFSRTCPPPTVVDNCTDQQARLLALLERPDEALVLYDAVFADSLRNGDQPTAFWYDEYYWHQFAAWLALQPTNSIQRSRGLAYWATQMQRFEDNGVKCHAASYQRASQAALSGDQDAARRHLEEAIASGWIDATALDRDLEWRPYAQTPWMHAVRSHIDALATAERAKMTVLDVRLSKR